MSESISFVTDADDIAACRAVRRMVFIDEQGVSEADEIDGRDDAALHLLARIDGQPVGAARVLLDGDVAKIGRVCVLADRRGAGLAGRMMAAILAHLRTLPQVRHARLSSQVAAITLYERAGFTQAGARYIDAGLPHQDMHRPL